MALKTSSPIPDTVCWSPCQKGYTLTDSRFHVSIIILSLLKVSLHLCILSLLKVTQFVSESMDLKWDLSVLNIGRIPALINFTYISEKIHISYEESRIRCFHWWWFVGDRLQGLKQRTSYFLAYFIQTTLIIMKKK